MSIVHWHECDAGCGAIDETHPDDGTPAGWYLVAQMKRPGGWDDDSEWHLCSIRCLKIWAATVG